MMGCVDSSLRTRTATFYFSVVLGSKAVRCAQMRRQAGRAQQHAAGGVRRRTRLSADVRRLSPDCSERINEEIPQTTSHLRSPVMRHCYSIIFLLEERNALSTTLLESQRSILCSEVFEPNAFKICVYHAGSRIRHD